jgi:hypothetical protein
MGGFRGEALRRQDSKDYENQHHPNLRRPTSIALPPMSLPLPVSSSALVLHFMPKRKLHL